VDTINAFYKVNLTQKDAKAFLEKEIEKHFVVQPKNLEEKAINMMGKPLYEAFIKGYTTKQWGKDPKKLPESIINRIPIRFNKDNTYFHHSKWQGLPTEGYTKIFEKLLSHPNIKVQLKTDYIEHRKELIPKEKIIYTGPLDRFFDNKLGSLDWRSVFFKKEVQLHEHYQVNSVLNFPDMEKKQTRIHEPKYLHPERNYPKDKTLVLFEFPTVDPTDPYYPVNDDKNSKLQKRYLNLAANVENLIVGGRLGGYHYFDMDQTIASALRTFS
jgi:UDP-galactopyranose mutase